MDLLRSQLARFFALLTPPPVSPLFLPGAALGSLNEDLTLIAATLLYLLLLDALVLPRVLRNPQKSRWFALHAAGNAVVTVAAAWDVVRTFAAPVANLVGPTGSMLPNAAISAIHLYHLLFFRLSADDIFHHGLFVGVLCPLGVVFKNDGGASLNFGAFFLCGLPGGLNYAALVLNKEGRLTNLQQKWFDAAINTWMRAPALAVFAFLQWQVWAAGARPARGWHPHLITFNTAAVAALHFYNGMYYAEQSVGNYHAHLEREKAAAAAGGGEAPGAEKKKR